MAANQTQNYGLNQWELSDSVVMAEFNADNQKVDAALSALNQRIDTAVADATQKVNEAAAAAAKNLNTAIAAVTATIPHVKHGSYLGTGTCGEESPCTLTFDFTPKLVIVSQVVQHHHETGGLTQYNTRFVAVRGTSICFSDDDYTQNGALADLFLDWGTNSLSWYARSTEAQGNTKDITYYYIAIG